MLFISSFQTNTQEQNGVSVTIEAVESASVDQMATGLAQPLASSTSEDAVHESQSTPVSFALIQTTMQDENGVPIVIAANEQAVNLNPSGEVTNQITQEALEVACAIESLNAECERASTAYETGDSIQVVLSCEPVNVDSV